MKNEASVTVLSRLGLRLLIATICTAVRLILHSHFPPSIALTLVAILTVSRASRDGERIGGASLNRWDEAMTYLGLSALTRLVNPA